MQQVMPTVQRSLRSLKTWAGNHFIQNIGWLTIAQVINRVFRLATTIIVARVLLPEEYGMIAVIFSVHELLFVVLRRSTQTRLIQAPASRLDRLCATTYTLNWLLAVSLFLAQCSVAWGVATNYHNRELLLPICVLGLIYLQLPVAMIQAGLNIRQGKMKVVAQIDAMQTLLESIMVIAFVLAGFGIWSLVLPKIIATPVWISIHHRHCPWRPTQHWVLQGAHGIIKYSRNVLSIDVLTVIRNNVDYLLVGYFLGLDVLGLYFFAYNAGLGISQGLTSSISASLLPHLCAANQNKNSLQQRYHSGLKVAFILIGLLVLVQTSLAEHYVPLVFGEHWASLGVVPLLIILCLSALPRMFAEIASQLLRAADHPLSELKWNLTLTITVVIALIFGLNWGITGVAWSVLIAHLMVVPLFLHSAYRTVFGRSQLNHANVNPIQENTL